MIKSVTYLGEGKRSYEVTEESDIQALETDLAEGSSVRVVGKIESEYELQGGTWRKTSGGSADNRFVVNCTPTAADYNGTMDKTVDEIKDAFLLGKLVYFRVADVGMFLANSYASGSVGTTIIDTANNRMIRVFTVNNNIYSTKIFQLTRLGS